MLKINKNKTVNNLQSVLDTNGDIRIINSATRNLVGRFYFTSIDSKDTKRFIKTVERLVRTSPSYSGYVKYLSEQGLVMDVVYSKITAEKATLEFHHYPFTLYDIVEIVVNYHVRKRDEFTSLSIAEEVIKLHYENLIGMARLAKTSHQLTHAGKLFVPLDSVFGNVNEFVHRYYDGLFPDQIETFNSLIAYDETYPGLPVKDPNIPWAYIGGFLKDI